MTPIVEIIHGDYLHTLPAIKEKCRLAYTDPPFNTGKVQRRGELRYNDSFDDYQTWLLLRLDNVWNKLTDDGSMFVHLDYREVHYMKVALDEIWGRDHFMNEIIWSYDYGGRPKNKWPCKHDTILWYVRDPGNYVFNYDEIDRIPYMAPALCGPKKAARGKTPTDTWWGTIVPTNGKEKTGYPTQKPLWLLERIVKVHSHPGDWLCDPFAGSGSFGHAAALNNRNCLLFDTNEQAIKVMDERLDEWLWI